MMKIRGVSTSRLLSSTSVATDELVRCLTSNGSISVKVLVATSLIQKAAKQHGCSAVATIALGRALMGAVLMTAGKDEGETLQLQIIAGGPLGLIMTEAVTAKEVQQITCRGFVLNPSAIVPNLPDGSLDVAAAVGGPQGVLRVKRSHPLWKEPHFSTTSLESGLIAEDIARFMLQSDQIPTAVGLGVLVSECPSDNGPISVTAAAGFLVSALPGVSEEELTLLERNVLNLPQPTDLLNLGMDASDIAKSLLAGLEPSNATIRSDPRSRSSREPNNFLHGDDGDMGVAGLPPTPLMLEKEYVSLSCSCSSSTALYSLDTAYPGRIQTERVPVTCEWCGTVRLA